MFKLHHYRMFTHYRRVPPEKLNCPHAMGTNTLSPQRPKSFRHILLLPSSSPVDNRRELPNLRVSVGAGAPQLQTPGLRICAHAGACPPPTQRTARGRAGRCAEVVELRSIAAPAWERRAFLAKAVLRFQHSQLLAICGEAALHSLEFRGPQRARFWLAGVIVR